MAPVLSHREQHSHHRVRLCQKHAGLTTLIALLLVAEGTRACSTLLAGKKATSDGSVIVTHSDDGEGTNDPRVAYVPAADFKPGELRPVYPDTENYPRYVGYHRGPDYRPTTGENLTQPIGHIPQVAHTFAYFDGNYGIMNEHQVVTGGESTCSGVFAAKAMGKGGKALFSVNALSRIALERAKTAREAIGIMGHLAETHGFYGASHSFEGSSESLLVADKEEGWVFHVLPDDTGAKAVWVAQRVPDEEVTVVMNMFTIRQVNLKDAENFLGTEYMYAVAERNGWWKASDGLLDFTKVFSGGEYSHKFYSGRRMWGAFSLLSPTSAFDPRYENLREKPAYPWSVKPDALLTVDDVATIHRYYYQGTEFSLGGDGSTAAGPFGNPDRLAPGPGEAAAIKKSQGRGSWERPIALFRSTYSYIVQTRSWMPDSVGALMWLGPHAAHGTCYMPYTLGPLPKSITTGSMTALDKTTAFWTFRYIHNISHLRYVDLAKVVADAQKKWESKGHDLVQQVEKSIQATEGYDIDNLAELYANHTAEVLSSWWEMGDLLMWMYADGFNNNNNGAATGYPEWWLLQVGYQYGPPPVSESVTPIET